jgi:hypothetical protein
VASLEAAAIAECFSECLTVLKEHASHVSCELPADYKPGQSKMIDGKHFEAIVNDSVQCAGLPFTSLEQLMGWAMGEQCTHFRRPSPLWATNDKSMYSISSECAVKEGSTRRSDIFENGTCPEGTHCDCPRNYLVSYQTPLDVRTEGSNLFVVQGSAGLPSYLRQQAASLLTRVAIFSVLMPGAGLAAIGMQIITSPMTWFRWVGDAFNGVRSIMSHQCQFTAGCWLDKPKRGKHGCRLYANTGAVKGNNDVWFMPPPYLKLTKSWFWCKVDSCNMREKVEQEVGLNSERTEVKNCQPLSFEEMDLTEKKEFVTKLEESGLHEEYPSDFANVKNRLGMR